MSQVAVIIKVMPESPDVDLEKVENSMKESLENEGAQNLTFEEKPIAFGLKAIFAKFAWPEAKATDLIEDLVSKIEHVSSVTIEDYRRAFG